MSHSSIPQRQPQYQIEEIDGEMLLYSAESTETIYLNNTGSIIWELCDGVRTIQEIIDLLKESYPDHSTNLESDVTELLDEFVNYKCITMLD